MFQQKPEDRLRAWREFRTVISDLPLELALTRTAEFWARAPFTPYNLDVTVPDEWPDPWTLIEENTYCDVAKCLGIVYTLSLCKHKRDLDIEIRVYQDSTTGLEYNLAWIDQGKYILNMIDSQVLNNTQVEKTFRQKHRFTALDLKLDYYNN
jgi:hypothetical protein